LSAASAQYHLRRATARRVFVISLPLGFPLVFPTFLLGVALVVAACGVALVVGRTALDFFLACLLLCVLVDVPAGLAVLGLLGS